MIDLSKARNKYTPEERYHYSLLQRKYFKKQKVCVVCGETYKRKVFKSKVESMDSFHSRKSCSPHCRGQYISRERIKAYKNIDGVIIVLDLDHYCCEKHEDDGDNFLD